MDTADDAASNQLTTGQANKESQSEPFPILMGPEGFLKEDEDFFPGLGPEEKESLEYLLQIISTLDEDVEEWSDEKTAKSVGDEDQVHSVDSSTKQRACMEVNATMPGPQPAVSKVKTIKSLSEESVDNTLKSKPSLCSPKDKGPPRSADSHCRNFDTITRSGVNVQELRSRFLDRLDSSTTTKEPRGAATVKQPGLLTGGPRSPRDEALQKLGLLQRN